jgi:riboflavin biosynthesis pyrimidine reductase
MISSVDGKTDGKALHHLMPEGEYERTGSELGGDAWLCGRVTMQKDFAKYAEKEPFQPESRKTAGPQPPHIARKAKSYAIAADPRGKVHWKKTEIDGDHILCLLTEEVPADYLAMLRKRGISYIVSGAQSIDFARAFEILYKEFGIRTLLLEGGGHINGGVLEAGLVDELSLVLLPGIDGRHEIPAVFDGRGAGKTRAVPLSLKSVMRRENDALWLRYKVVRRER